MIIYDPLVNSSIAPFGYAIFLDKATVISLLKSAAWSFFPLAISSHQDLWTTRRTVTFEAGKDAASANDWLLLPPKNEQLQHQTKDF